MFNKKLQKFSIRKLSVGAASVLIGISLVSMRDNNTVHAASNVNTVQTQSNDLQSAEDALRQGQENNAQIDQAKQDQASLPQDITNKNKDITQDKQNIDQTKQDQQKSQDTANKAQDSLSNAQKAQDEANKAAQAAQNTANKANSDLNQAKDNAKTAQDNANKANDGVKENQKSQDQTKADLENTVNDYNTQVNKINDLNSQIAQTTKDAAALDTQVGEAQKAQDEAQAKADSAAQALADAQNKYNEAKKAYGDKAQALDDTNKKIDSETASLNKNTDQLNSLNDNLNALKEALSKAQNDFDAAQAAKTEATQRLNDLTTQAQQLKSNLTAAQSDLAKAKQALNDAQTAQDDQIVLSDTYKQNVETMRGMEKIDNDTYTQPWVTNFDDLDDNNATWAALRKQASDSSWTLSHFKDNEADEKENIDLYNVTPEQQLRLTLYAARLINNVRMQLGTPLITVNSDAIEMAREIADGYNADNRANLDGQHHDNRAINQVSADWGIKHGKSMTTGGAIDQWIEDMGGFWPGYTLVENTDYHSAGFTTTGYGPEDQRHVSMNQLKSYIYFDLKRMVLEPDEWGHMKNITAALGNDAIDAQRGPVYFGFSTNYKEGLNGGSTHFILIADRYVQKDSKFNKNATVDVPSVSDLTNDVNSKQDNIDSINNDIKNTNLNIDQANSDIANAQDKANDANSRIADNNTKIASVNSSIANTQAKIDANNSKLNDLNALKKALQDDSPVLYQMYVEAGNALKTAQNNSDDANSDLAAKKTATNKISASRDNAYKVLAAQKSNLETVTKKANSDAAKQIELTKTLDNLKKQAPILADAVTKASADLASAQEKAIAAQKIADDANKALAEVKANAAAKTADLEKAQNVADNAKAALKKANDAVTSAQTKLNADTKALKGLQDRLNEVNNFLATASYADINALQARVDEAKRALAAMNTEEPMTGVAHIKNNITLVNGKGEAVSQTINANTNYKVFAKKTINGKIYYRLGTDNQWVVEDAVSSITDGVPAKSNTEEPFAAHGYIPVLKSHPTWKIALVDGNGNYTGQYLPTNTKWKVFAKKTINGQTYYRLGTDQQWIPASFLQVKKTGVVKANPVKNHPTWKIALLNQNGEYTGEFVKPNTSWKVLDVEFINGRMMARIGNQAQWIPMEFVSWVK